MENSAKRRRVFYKIDEGIIFVVKNVVNFLKSLENCKNMGILDFLNLIVKVTGLSLSSVRKIINDEKTTDPAVKPGPKHNHITDLTELQKSEIRNIIYNFPETEKRTPTLNEVLQKVKNDLGFEGGRSSLRKIIRELGFRYTKAKNNRTVLIERPENRLKRIEYLRKIGEYRAQNRPIFYLDESYIHQNHCVKKRWDDKTGNVLKNPIPPGARFIFAHCGNEEGFVPNARLVFKSGCKTGDYHDEMNNSNYSKWVELQLIPNLPPKSVVVVDNAPYHNKILDPAPNSNSNKQAMKDWLQKHNIPFNPKALKLELYELVKKNKHRFVEYVTDKIFEKSGHDVLRLPPYHCDLNPIENIWGITKNNVALRNTEFIAQKTLELLHEELDKITPEIWRRTCQKVWDLEKKFLTHEQDNDENYPVEEEDYDDSDIESD